MPIRDWIPIEAIKAKVKIILEDFIPSMLLLFIALIVFWVGKYALPQDELIFKMLIWMDEFVILVISFSFFWAIFLRLIKDIFNNGHLPFFIAA
jgi:hypothetical protein